MNTNFYTYIGYAVVWCGKYIVIPFGVAVLSKLFVIKLLQPQPERQRKKRYYKNRFNK